MNARHRDSIIKVVVKTVGPFKVTIFIIENTEYYT